MTSVRYRDIKFEDLKEFALFVYVYDTFDGNKTDR